MSLSESDKLWIQQAIRREVNSAIFTLSQRMPRGILHTLGAAITGFMVANTLMDIKNKNIPHISYPLAEIERILVEGAGQIAIWTGGFMADYNRMYPSLSVAQNIIGLSNTQASALMQLIRQKESSNRYNIVNNYGYIGAYSMSAIALADIGYIKLNHLKRASHQVKEGTDKTQHWGFLKNKNNWARYDYSAFMTDKNTQDRAFIALANLNIQRAYKGGTLKRGDHQRIGGFVAAAHLVGYSNAVRYYGINIDSSDRNGTTASSYAKLGERAIKGQPPLDANSRPNGLPFDRKHYSRISSKFGYRTLRGKRQKHLGIDFAMPVNTPVKATADGKVVYAGNYQSACGYGVKIQHENNYSTIFCHLSVVIARRGEWLRKGAIIGKSGGKLGSKGAGSSTGAHVHYAIKLNRNAIDPAVFLPTLPPVKISRHAGKS